MKTLYDKLSKEEQILSCELSRQSCAPFAVDCDLSLRADTGGSGLLTAVPRLPLTGGGGGCCALLPCAQRKYASGRAGQVRVGPEASLHGREAGLHSRALAGAALFAEQGTEQSQELFPHTTVHVAINVWVEAALQKEEHEGKGGQPLWYDGSGTHRYRVQYAVRPHAEDVRSHNHENYTSCLAVIVEPSVPDSNRVPPG